MSEDLYVKPYESLESDVSKLASMELPVDIKEWPPKIKEKLLSEHPYLGKFNVKVDLKNTDKESQSGIGSIGVRADKKTLFIPLIVEEGEIKPFDIMIHEGETKPLTKEKIKEIFRSFEISNETADDDELRDFPDRDSIYDEQLNAPNTGLAASDGKVTTASVEPGNMIKNLDGKVREDDVSKIADALNNDDRLAASFAETSGGSVIENVMDIDPNKNGEVKAAEVLENFKPSDVFLCKEASPNTVEMYSTPRKIYHPRKQEVSFNLAEKTLKEAGFDAGKLDELSPNNDVVFVPDDNNGTKKESANNLLKVNSPGKYDVFTKSGQKKQAYVFPDVFNYDNEKTSGKIVFSDGEIGYQEEVAGNAKSASVDNHSLTPPADEPEEDDIGFFYYKEGKRTVATEPFKINQIATVGDNEAIYAETKSGKEIRMTRTQNIEGITKIEDPSDDNLSSIGKTVYLIPDKMSYVSADEQSEFIDNPDANPEKAKEAMGLKLHYNDNTFSLSGCNVQKMVSGNDDSPVDSVDDLERSDVEFLLGLFDLPETEIKETITEARNNGKAYVKSDIEAVKSKEALDKSRGVVDFVREKVAEIRRDLFKEAAVLSQNESSIKKEAEEPTTGKGVDSLLSLSLVREENIKEYIQNIETYESVAQDLSEMLLYARIGANNLPESALRKSIQNLNEVIDGLRQLRATFS